MNDKSSTALTPRYSFVSPRTSIRPRDISAYGIRFPPNGLSGKPGPPSVNDAPWITRDRAIVAGAVLILLAYGIQIATKKCVPLIYWFAVTAVAIFGTMSSDFLIENLNWTLWQDSLVWLVAQAQPGISVLAGQAVHDSLVCLGFPA